MTSTSNKQDGTITGETKGQVTKKSGKGNNHGFISEVSTYFTVKPINIDFVLYLLRLVLVNVIY